MRENNLPLIVFEGIDKVGKTTLHKEFDKYVKYRYLTCDRLFLTYIAYAQRYSRPIMVESLNNWLYFNRDQIIIIYVTASNETLLKRYKEVNHENVNIDKDKRAFVSSIQYLQDRSIKVITINTDNQTPLESVKEILEQLDLKGHHNAN